MNLRCTSCAKYCCDGKRCSCACHKKSFSRSNQYLAKIMDNLSKQKITPIKKMNIGWQTNFLGSMMRVE